MSGSGKAAKLVKEVAGQGGAKGVALAKKAANHKAVDKAVQKAAEQAAAAVIGFATGGAGAAIARRRAAALLEGFLARSHGESVGKSWGSSRPDQTDSGGLQLSLSDVTAATENALLQRKRRSSGGGGIRTLGPGGPGSAVFKTAPFNRSGTPPSRLP
jgi:hypothetical protein